MGCFQYFFGKAAMKLHELRVRFALVRIRHALSFGNIEKGQRLAVSAASKFSDDVRISVLLADAFLFGGKSVAAESQYDQAIETMKKNACLPKGSRRYLGAYISIRKQECEFLDNRTQLVVTPEVVEGVNALPAGLSLKALFFLDARSSTPRQFGSRRASKRENEHFSNL